MKSFKDSVQHALEKMFYATVGLALVVKNRHNTWESPAIPPIGTSPSAVDPYAPPAVSPSAVSPLAPPAVNPYAAFANKTTPVIPPAPPLSPELVVPPASADPNRSKMKPPAPEIKSLDPSAVTSPTSPKKVRFFDNDPSHSATSREPAPQPTVATTFCARR